MTRDKDDEKELYNLLGDKDYRKFLDSEFKSEKSNFHISINVDMWITGFDVPCLTMLYNDKPLSKHTLIQTISRVNRKFGTKECGFIIDYIDICVVLFLSLIKTEYAQNSTKNKLAGMCLFPFIYKFYLFLIGDFL